MAKYLGPYTVGLLITVQVCIWDKTKYSPFCSGCKFFPVFFKFHEFSMHGILLRFCLFSLCCGHLVNYNELELQFQSINSNFIGWICIQTHSYFARLSLWTGALLERIIPLLSLTQLAAFEVKTGMRVHGSRIDSNRNVQSNHANETQFAPTYVPVKMFWNRRWNHVASWSNLKWQQRSTLRSHDTIRTGACWSGPFSAQWNPDLGSVSHVKKPLKSSFKQAMD